MAFLCFQTQAGTEMRCHDITIQEKSQTTSLKKRKRRTDVNKCFQQWHIMGSHYQVTRRLVWKEQNLRQENIIISKKKNSVRKLSDHTS